MVDNISATRRDTGIISLSIIGVEKDVTTSYTYVFTHFLYTCIVMRINTESFLDNNKRKPLWAFQTKPRSVDRYQKYTI